MSTISSLALCLLLILSVSSAYNRSSYSCSWYSSTNVNLYVPSSIAPRELDRYSAADGCCLCNSHPGDFVALDDGWPVTDYSFRTFSCPSHVDYCKSASAEVLASVATEKCKNPIGNDCEWYERCQDSLNTCQSSTAKQFVKSEKRLCEKYQNHFRLFSADGQKWINGVRECLQKRLAFNFAAETSCDDLTATIRSFDSVVRCYIDNGICEFSWFEWFKIMYTVRDVHLLPLKDSNSDSARVLNHCNAKKVQNFQNIFVGGYLQAGSLLNNKFGTQLNFQIG